MSLVDRTAFRQQIQQTLEQFRVAALLGPRQCGKTTLARTFEPSPDSYFDLEDPLDLTRLQAPRQTLSKLTGLVVIDEIQHRPDLFPLLRVLADRPGIPARSGARMAGPSWTCCWCAAAIAGASNSSMPRLPAPPNPCAWPPTI